ncbi:MAG: hypothetical protein HZT40_03090 [Candidatus Thiothrix singaporensis]|uniref:Uncharacterized protein n=1 Tax=Candidatus Thiothrix singaporensis TaxID=2799669 RepID=A0A7L6ANV4_9GAMM|nr:MAG: hypothetical protein HZT40_03090 [Candidatus Thiothrix singaporensis]
MSESSLHSMGFPSMIVGLKLLGAAWPEFVRHKQVMHTYKKDRGNEVAWDNCCPYSWGALAGKAAIQRRMAAVVKCQLEGVAVTFSQMVAEP